MSDHLLAFFPSSSCDETCLFGVPTPLGRGDGERNRTCLLDGQNSILLSDDLQHIQRRLALYIDWYCIFDGADVKLLHRRFATVAHANKVYVNGRRVRLFNT